MNALRQYAFGERPRLALAVVAAAALLSTALLAVLGIFEVSTSEPLGQAVFTLVFVVLPVTAGASCGALKLGYPAAAAGGVLPGVAFYFVVAVGAALNIGSFGGGDSPLVAFSMLLAAGGFVWATAGFAVGVGIGVVSERRDG